MNAARVIAVGLAIACLSACGSNDTVEDRYYSLVLAAGPAGNATDDGAAHLIVGPIELPRYLDGRGLSMQVGPNRIETANHHFWAEPLDEAIAKVLARDIDENTDDLVVQRESGRWSGNADCRLRIEFDAFHPTFRSDVVVTGRYWIGTDDNVARRDFSLRRGLTADGYAHAVDVLRGALADLAEQVSDDLAAESGCTA
ncbi:MAG: PqiC family protein [Woeseiaceae bacterium]|nr:PqiC family protein [Woeseiaceae bacterium]